MPLGESQVVTLVDVHRAHHGQTLTLVGVCVNRIGKHGSTFEIVPKQSQATGSPVASAALAESFVRRTQSYSAMQQ